MMNPPVIDASERPTSGADEYGPRTYPTLPGKQSTSNAAATGPGITVPNP